METLLRKYLWAVDGVVIALCMIFLARAASTAVERKMLSTGPAAQGRPCARRCAAAAPVYTKQVEDILKRNIFCSTCPPILGKPEDANQPPQAPPLQRTSLNLKLLAIMFAPPPADPRWSVAIIRDNDAKSAGPYNVGSKIREAIVDDIVEDRVYLDFGGGRREYLDLLDRSAAGASALRRRRPRRRRIRSPPSWTRASRRWASTTTRCSARRSTRCWATWARSRRARASSPRPATASRPASACSASAPTVRSRRSAC